jgi:hypothetical protein
MANLPSRRHAEALFWGTILFLLAVGAGSWILNARLFPPELTGWLRLQPDMTSWTGFFLGIGIWVGAGAACFGLLKLISMAPHFLRAIVAMWRPVVILCAAGYLLFFNDQGRELGISLLGENYGWPLFFLFIGLPTTGTQHGSEFTPRLNMARSVFLLCIPRNFQREAQTGASSQAKSAGSIGRLAFLACAPICSRRSICL